jgi:hypothetical protein
MQNRNLGAPCFLGRVASGAPFQTHLAHRTHFRILKGAHKSIYDTLPHVDARSGRPSPHHADKDTWANRAAARRRNSACCLCKPLPPAFDVVRQHLLGVSSGDRVGVVAKRDRHPPGVFEDANAPVSFRAERWRADL